MTMIEAGRKDKWCSHGGELKSDERRIMVVTANRIKITAQGLGLFLLAAALGGCGVSQLTSSIGDGGMLSGEKKKPENASWTPIITEESMLTAARTNSDGAIEMATSNGCPALQVEGGQRYLTVHEGNRVGDGNAVIHRGEITKTARECQFVDNQVIVKYGIAGRVLLGPKGKPGTITLPVMVQVIDKAKAKVKSEPFTITVTITKENPLTYFSLVRDVTIPIKQGTQPADYAISLAFEKTKPGAV